VTEQQAKEKDIILVHEDAIQDSPQKILKMLDKQCIIFAHQGVHYLTARYVLIDCRRDMGNEDPENPSVVETDIKKPHL